MDLAITGALDLIAQDPTHGISWRAAAALVVEVASSVVASDPRRYPR